MKQYTINQIRNGEVPDVTKVELEDYAKKNEVGNLIDLNGLRLSIDKKLPKEPQHKHIIDDVDELQKILDDKLDCKTQYSYKTILSDIDQLDYITNINCKTIRIGVNKTDGPVYGVKGYSFMISDSNDLYIMSGLIPIATFNYASKSWSFNGVNLNEFKNNVEEVLQNHYEAIKALMPDYVDETPNDKKIN